MKDCPILAKEDKRPITNCHYLCVENDYKIKKTFGFIASPELTILENTKDALKNMSQKEYFNKMNTNAYHNLCTSFVPPLGVGSLLSLGMKICIKTPYPERNSLKRRSIDSNVTLD